MMAVIGKIAAALSQSAGHTVEVYKTEESMPNFRVFITTTEEGDHAVVMLRGSKVTVIPFFKEMPEKLIWHIEIIRKELPGVEVEVVTRETAESDSLEMRWKTCLFRSSMPFNDIIHHGLSPSHRC
jgi:hypothetical protein